MKLTSAFLTSLLLFMLPGVAAAQTLDDMISPITHFAQFEDPRINSEIKPTFVYHELDDDFVSAGGDVQLYAVQARFAVTEDFAIIATKDGYIDFNPDANIPQDEGFADIGLGVKYALYQDNAGGEIVTAGLRYEIPVGDDEVFQGEGDGEINPFLSAAKSFGNLNVMVGTGFRFAIDDSDSSFYDFDIHFDYKIGNFYPLIEFGVYHVLDAGDRLPIADEGVDLFNFGSSEADGKTMVTAGAGARYRISDSVDLGAAYQIPLTSGEGSNLLDWRITTDLIYSFDLS